MHVKISRAYYGNNNDWMSQMMENTSDIPLESYINKYDTVYGNFQCAAILISGFFVILRFISGNLEKIRKWELSILTKINVHRSLLLEVLFIVPLVFSSGMWLRVALATPPTSFSELIIAPPLVLSDESEQIADINDITFSPLQFNFWAEGQTAGKRIYFPDISFSDAGFMEMTTDNAFIYNHQGQLGIQILKTGNVNIRINLQYFPFIIMLLSWFLIIPLLIIKRKVL